MENEELVKLMNMEKEKLRMQKLNNVLELKANTDIAFQKICGENEKRNQWKEEQVKMENKQYERLLKQGKNPYEVFRRKTIQKRKSRLLEIQELKIRDKEMKIAQNMINDEMYAVNMEKQEKRHKDYVKKYQNELGRKGRQDKINAYMQEKTNSELIDPTGRLFRMQPSQVTNMKDHSFGLGKSSTKSSEMRNGIIDEIQRKRVHRKVTPDDRFVPKVPQGIAKNIGNVLVDTIQNEMEPSVPGQEGALQKDRVERDVTLSDTRKVYQENRRKKGLDLQKQNRVQKQIVWGKEFKGQAFLPNPSVIWFKDFVVGQKRTITFKLTNVSNTFNNFKIMDLPSRICNFFDIEYEKPGRMSAGTTCLVKITFDPKMNVDIDDHIPVCVKTGDFTIPLKCTIQRIVPELNLNVVEFKDVVRGEMVKTSIVLKNTGAMASEFTITMLDEQISPISNQFDKGDEINASHDIVRSAIQKYDTIVDGEKPFLSYTQQGVLQGYSSTKLMLAYNPYTCEKRTVKFGIQFTEGDVDMEFHVHANCSDVPIYVQDKVLDFKTCVYDKLYRTKLNLWNRGKVALKCQVHTPRELKECIEFSPDFGYVQGCSSSDKRKHGKFDIQIKFQPIKSVMEKCKQYICESSTHDTMLIAIPIKISVSDQVLPVSFVLTADLCSSDVKLSHHNIDFGPCYINQAIQQEVWLTNTSKLPQKYGFVKLPAFVCVQPNDGFGILLPYEEKMVNVVFMPTSTVHYDFKVQLQTTMNQLYIIHCTGQGSSPELLFSETVVKFGAISAQEYATHSINVLNTTNKKVYGEFCIPKAANTSILVRPQVLALQPHQVVRLELEFRPQVDTKLSIKNENTESEINDDAEAQDAAVDQENDVPLEQSSTIDQATEINLEKDSDDSITANTQTTSDTAGTPGVAKFGVPEPEPQNEDTFMSMDDLLLPPISKEVASVHNKWLVPCIIKSDESTTPMPILALELHTTVTSEIIEPSTRELSFGQLAVGRVQTLKLVLKNLGINDEIIKMKPLQVLGPYRVVNALRPIRGLGSFTIFVEFKPEASYLYRETLSILSNVGTIHVLLHGEGVSPTLRLEPENGNVHLANVLAGEHGIKTVTMHNQSEFPLSYNIESQEEMHSNFNNIAVFSCTPSRGMIPAHGEQAIKVTFSPDHARPVEYVNTFKIVLPNQSDASILTLRGRSWDRQGYVLPSSKNTASDPLDERTTFEQVEHIFDYPPAVAIPETLKSWISPKFNRRIYITFPKDHSSLQESLILGSIAMKNSKQSSTVTFDIAPHKTMKGNRDLSCFEVQPLKGNLNPGMQQSVTIDFTPPAFPGQSNDEDSKLVVGQWTEICYTCTLTGGYVPPGSQLKEQVVDVIVRGYIRIY